MLMELPLWGLEKPLDEGEAEPKDRSPSEARFFSGRGGCPGRVSGLWWPLWPGVTVRKLEDRKPLSPAAAAVRGVLGAWGAPWEWTSKAPGSSPGARQLPTGAVPKPRKAWPLGGPRASGGSVRDSWWLWKGAWSSAGGRWGRPGLSGPRLEPGNSPEPRTFPAGRPLPNRASEALGLLSTHGSSADGGLLERQSNQNTLGGARRSAGVPQAAKTDGKPVLRLPQNVSSQTRPSLFAAHPKMLSPSHLITPSLPPPSSPGQGLSAQDKTRVPSSEASQPRVQLAVCAPACTSATQFTVCGFWQNGFPGHKPRSPFSSSPSPDS